jgi:uncharacterized protein (DUF362 family)
LAVAKRARVAITQLRDKHRTREAVLDVVRSAVNLAGGLSHLMPAGARVLVKPDAALPYTAEEGCTTDPLVVGALVALAREAGAARVLVGESSTSDSIDRMRATGIAQAALREGAELVDLGSEAVPTRTVTVPGGRVLDEVPLAVPLLDADFVIDVPKAKTHYLDPVSGALENWLGVVPRSWRAENLGDADTVARFMDVMTACRPHLSVVDAILVGEGDGPLANVPRWCGCVIASTDPVAADVTIARLLGRSWQELRFALEAESRGLGVRQPIDYVGTPLAQVAFEAWPAHERFDNLPVRVLVGRGVRLEGSVGHVKTVLDLLLRRGELARVLREQGTPTVLIGNVEDPRFEEHLEQGPYIVVDDAAPEKYRTDARVTFVPGHPVLREAMPSLFRAFGLERPEPRRPSGGARPFAVAGLVVAGLAAAAAIAGRAVRR